MYDTNIENFYKINGSNKKIDLRFKTIEIKGDIQSNDEILSEIELLNTNAARRFEKNIVTGQKQFNGNLATNEFNGNLLNGLDMILSNFTDLQIISIKKFDHLIIAGNTGTGSIDMERMNGFNLRSFFIHSIKIDQNVICDDEMIFNHLISDSITIDSNENFKFIDRIFIDSVFSVVIAGDAKFDDVIDLNLLNSIEINNFMELTVSNYFGGAIGGLKVFEGSVTINDLMVNHLRNINLSHVYKNILRRSKSQEIPAKWTFNQIDCFSLKSLIVDGINKNLLIEKTDVLEVFNDLIVDYLMVESRTKGVFINFDLIRFDGTTIGPKWRNITVLGTRNLMKSNIYDKLIENSVLINENQVINGNVYFKNTVLFNKMKNPIEDFDLLAIFNDSMKKIGEKQIINGKVSFNQWKINQLVSINDNQVFLINNLNTVSVHKTIFRLKSDNHNIVTGKKQFLANPMINNLKTDYLINNINVRDLIFSYNNQKLINFKINKIKVKEFRINQINQINFVDFLINKINKKQINTKLVLEKLILNNINIDCINNLKLSDLIELKSNQLQQINKKLIINQVIINNELLINNLNNKNLIELFNQTVFINNEIKMKNLSLKSIILNQGFYLRNPWQFNQQKVNKVNKSVIPIKEKESIFSFIDYASDIEIIHNQELFQSNSTIYVNRVFPSEQCGFCECPAQLGITPQPTYKIIIKKMDFFKRFFDLSSIKIITNFQSNCYQINETEILINNHKTLINDLITDVKRINNLLIISWTKSTSVHQIDESTNSLTKIQEFSDHPNESIIELINNQEILIISNRNARQTNIYKFNGKYFKKIQEIIGFYNLISGVTTNDVMLIVSTIGSMKIQIFKLNQESIFQLHQDISFESKIKTISALTTGRSILIGIALNDGYLSIYCYNYLQGWKLSTIGYFNLIESLVPIRIHQRDFILILQSNTTSIVSIMFN